MKKAAAAVCLAVILLFTSVFCNAPILGDRKGNNPVVAATTAGVLVWVRDSQAIINANNDPLESEEPEPRWAGSFSKMTVSETGFTTQERYVDHEYEYYNFTITCNFKTPAPELKPGQKYNLPATFSHSGTHKEGGEGMGEQFWYNSNKKGIIEPSTVLKYYPWSPNFEGKSSQEWTLTAPPISTGATFQVYAGLWNRPPCNVTWTYRAVETKPVEQPTTSHVPTTTSISQTTQGAITTSIPSTTRAISPETSHTETPRERLERSIMQNLLDYIEMYRRFEKDLQPLHSRADSLMESLRDARWFLANGTDEDKEQAQKDIQRLQAEIKDLLKSFNARAAKLEEVLDGIEEQFVDYEQKQALLETLQGFKSQLNLNRINLVLRSGNKEDFDTLFRQYRGDRNIADQVLVGNAFRRLMDGDTRTALESVKLALNENGENPTAQQLLRDLEIHYLDTIRDKLAGEQSENAKLFNEKLNGHGEEGIGGFLLDVLTTGTGESMQSLAAYLEIYQEKGLSGLARAGYQAVAEGQHPKGYYDFLQEVSSLNIDEATAQIAGIQFVRTLRQNGITLDEISSMTIPRLQEIIMGKFDGRALSEEEATVLRKRIWDAFRNPDVDALRKGEKMQLDVDTGRDYFDTGVLQQGTSDIIMRQFSAWDTFLTFAPSAQLGNICKMGVAQRLGLKAESTLQQALQKGLLIEELGQSLYQTRAGAAVIDATYQWNGFTEMVSQAIKKRIGETACASGSIAVQAAINNLAAPAREALQEELLKISDYYLGAETTGNVEATVDTLSSFFGFIGLNSQALQRGAYGIDNLENAKDKIQEDLTRRQAIASNPGVAQVSGRPVDFDDFEARVIGGRETYLKGLSDARDRIRGIANSPVDRRGMIASQADEALEQMEEAARALQQGDRNRARQIFESMQSGAGRNFDFANQQNVRKLGGATDLMRRISALESGSPTDRDFAAEITKQLMSFASETSSGEALTDTLIAAGLRVIPE